MVNFDNLLEEYKKSNLNYKLPVLLGVDAENKKWFADLVDLQNIIIGGTTGSGKSIFNHTIISTLISMYSYEKLRLYLVDPKLVELQTYKDIPHLLSPVQPETGDPHFSKVYEGFKWLIEEKYVRKRVSKEEFDKYPFIIVVIDTFSDLIAENSQKFQDKLTQLIDGAAEVNIYTIICDSRTGPDVFTDTLLKLFPTKIAFNTSTIESSQLLVEEVGAEKLLGRGDMLYLPQDLKKAVRIQAPFISEGEIKEMLGKYSK